jgi:hypothetical protein
MFQNGRQVKIPLTVNLHIEGFAGGHITRFNSGSTNLVYAQYDDGTWYATQRPGVNQFEDASATVADARGRGAYYWDQVADKYFVNNDTVYKGGYANPVGTITAGTQRVFMADIGDNLVILDAENNEGWYITSSAPTTVVAISDLDFPPNQTPALSLARGGCVLNGKLYVLTTGGDIYESAVEDPTRASISGGTMSMSWCGALDPLSSSRTWRILRDPRLPRARIFNMRWELSQQILYGRLVSGCILSDRINRVRSEFTSWIISICPRSPSRIWIRSSPRLSGMTG